MANSRENLNLLSFEDDLYHYPILKLKPNADEEITLGDLHANAMYFLHVLIYAGIVDFNDELEDAKIEKYKQLLEIYLRSPGPASAHLVRKYKHFIRHYGNYRDGMPAILSKDDVIKFKEIIGTLKVTNPVALVRLLGDEFADAGQCDEYVQAIITQLDILNIPNESLLSNHGIERLEAFEKREKEPTEKFYPPRLKAKVGTVPLGALQPLLSRGLFLSELTPGQLKSTESVTLNLSVIEKFIENGLDEQFVQVEEKARSMVATQQLIERNILKFEDVKAAHDNHYKLKLKVLSYTLSADKKDITIYSHAGIGLKTIRALAEKLKIKYQAHTAIALAATIDAINEKFQEHVKNNTVHTLYDHNVMRMAYHGAAQFCKKTDRITPPTTDKLISVGIPKETIDNCNITNNPFEFVMWCRRYDIDERPAVKTSSNYLQGAFYGGFNINFVHGHDSEDPQAVNVNLLTTKSHLFNLNNMIGRSIDHHKGKLFILSVRNNDKSQVLQLAEEFKKLDTNDNNLLSTQNKKDLLEDEFTLVETGNTGNPGTPGFKK